MAEEGVHLWNTQRWPSAMYQGKLWLQLPKECYLTKILSTNFSFLLEVTEETEVKKVKIFEKKQILQQQTIEIKQLKQINTIKYKYSLSQLTEFHPLLRVFRDHSTFQPRQLFRLLVHPVANFFERRQSWRRISFFYCPLFATKRTPVLSLF